MHLIDRGAGAPIVLIPGVQGRWEWMEPAVRALAARARVLTFSLADEPTSGVRLAGPATLATYVGQVREALDAAGLARATICGVSFGGLVAAAFAAAHPERTAALVLVSALPPGWRPDARVRAYLRAPRLLLPVFCLNALRLSREIVVASGGLLPAVRPALAHLWNVARHPFSPTLMAGRARMPGQPGATAGVPRVRVPTLVVTGERRLDHVVPVALTEEYLRLWPHAESATLARTGHLGHVTRPAALADLVVPFAERAAADPARRKLVG